MLAHKHICALLLTAIVVGATFGAAAAQRPAQQPERLFIPANQPALADEQLEMAVTRSRSVTIDWSTLQAVRPGDNLQLNLFDDVIIDASIISVSSENNVTTWIGQIGDDPLAQLIMVSSEGVVSGSVSTPDGLYEVRAAGGQVHKIQQIDQSAFPEEMPPVVIGGEQLEAAADQASDAPLDFNDDAGTIDVLVLYTPRARSAAGSEAAIRNLINLAVAETNTSYSNSGITQRLRLVNAQEIAYTEASSMDLDLSYLQGSYDSYMNQAHTLRDTYGADLVSLIVEASQYCGIAYMMDGVSTGFAAYGFSVVARSCATGYYSFGHELGHNMGAGHDWYVDTSVNPYTHSHGYVNVSERWRTVMAYNDECTAGGVSCTRLPFWSNPAVIRYGEPMGVASGTDTSCTYRDRDHPPCDADDHRTLNDTAFTVANFRRSVGGVEPTPTPQPLSSYPVKRYIPFVTH